MADSTKVTADKRIYAEATHFNGSNHILMPPGIFFNTKNRTYVDADGKNSDWNPNYPDLNLPDGVNAGWATKTAATK